MIELNSKKQYVPDQAFGPSDQLEFTFPEVHQDARFQINFQRTLRIPDDDSVHFLPPGLGNFPLRHVDDFSANLPETWRKHGGVMLPMFQSEALWLNFDSPTQYPFLLKIAAGKINAVTGEAWSDIPNRDPQDYLVVPDQPWLDGFCVKKGEVRQFVAMPLGRGYTAEEQLTGQAVHGGLQIIAYPMKAEWWEKIKPDPNMEPVGLNCLHACMFQSADAPSMGLAPGGRMKQDIYDDTHGSEAWDLRHGSRCFVHIANSLHWRAITGAAPPTIPPTAKQYAVAGLPWFDYFADKPALDGGADLEHLDSVVQLSDKKGESVLPENEPTGPVKVAKLKNPTGKVVREF